MAAGHYIGLSAFDGLELRAVTRQAACIASNTFSVYREAKGKNALEVRQKKERLKAAVLNWACETFPDFAFNPFCQEEGEAIADALAVGVAAGRAYFSIQRTEAEKAAQKALFAKKAGKGTKPKGGGQPHE